MPFVMWQNGPVRGPAAGRPCTIIIHVQVVDLRSRCALGHHMRIVEGAVLLGIRKLFNLEDLKFSVLLDKGDDPGVIDGELSAVCSACDCGLHRGRIVLRAEMM
jgi:hypothetical protein